MAAYLEVRVIQFHPGAIGYTHSRKITSEAKQVPPREYLLFGVTREIPEARKISYSC